MKEGKKNKNMGKIEINDTIESIIVKLSEGNPGAMRTLFEIMQFKGNNPFYFLETFLAIDNMKLYGSYLYMLWNDCCKNNIEKVFKVIEAYQRGDINDEMINERIRTAGYGISFDDIIGE